MTFLTASSKGHREVQTTLRKLIFELAAQGVQCPCVPDIDCLAEAS